MEVSFIVPIYNAGNSLRKCVESLVHQKGEDYEIVLVDDGSLDDSQEICEQYRSKYRNVTTVKHSQNKGVSTARNSGIRASTGKFLCFIDADDYVSDLFVRAISEGDSPNIDYMRFGMAAMKGDSVASVDKPSVEGVIPHDAFGTVGGGVQASALLHGLVFRRTVIVESGLEFNQDISRAEDSLFIKQFFYEMTGDFYQSSQVMYFFSTDCENSLTKKYYDKLTYAYTEIYYAAKKLEQRYPNYKDDHVKEKLVATMEIQQLYSCDNALSRKQRLEIIRKYMNDEATREAFIHNACKNKLDKIRRILFIIRSPLLLDIVYCAGKRILK